MQQVSAQSSSKPGGPAVPEVPCPRCTHANPAESKYCGACGAPLRQTGEGKPSGPDLPLEVERFKPLPRWQPRMVLQAATTAVVAVAAIGVLAYQAYGYFFYADISSAILRTKPAAHAGPDAVPGTQSVAAEPVRPLEAEADPKTVPEAATVATTAPVSAPVRPPRAAPVARKAVDREPPRVETCTEAMAAIGLCVLRPGQAKAPAPSAAQTPVSEQPRAASCTEGVSALGLCAPTSNPTKE